MNASEAKEEASWTRLAREIGKYEPLSNGELHAWHFPAEGETKATLVCLHGIQTHGAWFAPVAQKLTPYGYSLWCPDRRGSGMSPSLNEGGARLADIESARVWLDDVDKVVAAAAAKGAPVFLVGTSWGARPALAYAQEQGSKGKLSAVALVAPAFWTTVDSPIALWFAPVLRWFGLSTSLEKRLPPDIYLPKSGAASKAIDAADFRTQMRRDDSRLVKRVTFRALDEASRLSKIALRDRPMLPVTVFFDTQDALVKQPKSQEKLGNLGIPWEQPTSAGHGVQVISSENLADVLRSWVEKQRPAH